MTLIQCTDLILDTSTDNVKIISEYVQGTEELRRLFLEFKESVSKLDSSGRPIYKPFNRTEFCF